MLTSVAGARNFNYNALLLQSQGRTNRVLASGASFIFFFPSEATKIPL